MRVLIVLLFGFLSACASTHAKQYLGKSVSEIMLTEGRPANVIRLSDGRRAYQWYWGGGTVTLPGSAHSNVTVTSPHTATVDTTIIPQQTYSSRGCLLTYIARNRNGQWIVEAVHWPKRLVC